MSFHKVSSVSQIAGSPNQPITTVRTLLDALNQGERSDLFSSLCHDENWSKLAAALSLHSDKIDCDLIDGIKSRKPRAHEQLKVFLDLIQDAAEITPELFIEALDEIYLGAHAVHFAKKLGISSGDKSRKRDASHVAKSAMSQVAAKVSRLGKEVLLQAKQNPLEEGFWQFLNKRPLLRDKVAKEIGSSVTRSEKCSWKQILKQLEGMGNARFEANTISSIESQEVNRYKQSWVFLSQFKKLPSISLGQFLKALAATDDSYESLAFDILQEAESLDAFHDLPFPSTLGQENRPAIQSIQARSKSSGKLDERLIDFLNHRIWIGEDIRNALMGGYGPNHAWPRLLSELLKQPIFRGKFAPNPEAWCKALAKDTQNKREESDRILSNLYGLLHLTVRAFVTALSNSGDCFEALVHKICTAAEAPDFPLELHEGGVPEYPPTAANELAAARVALLEAEKVKAELAAAKRQLEELQREVPAAAQKRQRVEPAQAKEKAEEDECAICFGPREAVLLSCGDAKFCAKCVKDCTVCPVCRRENVTMIKIYK